MNIRTVQTPCEHHLLHRNLLHRKAAQNWHCEKKGTERESGPRPLRWETSHWAGQPVITTDAVLHSLLFKATDVIVRWKRSCIFPAASVKPLRCVSHQSWWLFKKYLIQFLSSRNGTLAGWILILTEHAHISGGWEKKQEKEYSHG